MIKKDDLKVAKRLYHSSFTKDRLDSNKIRKNIRSTKKIAKRNALPALKIYFNMLTSYVKRATLIVESSDKLLPHYEEEIKRHFEKKFNRNLNVELKVNKSLLGGLKITLEDDQWDFSIKGRINQFRKILHG